MKAFIGGWKLGEVFRVLTRRFSSQSSGSDPLSSSGPRWFRARQVFFLILFLPLFLSPVTSEALDDDIEKDLQNNLRQSKVLVENIKAKLAQGSPITTEITQLKTTAENIRISHLLLEERFTMREEKAKTHGSSALTRHQAMVEGYR